MTVSHISIIHYLKLMFRSCLFVVATILYVINKIEHSGNLILNSEHRPFILVFIWLIFVVEMFFRFFPSRLESMGCQKQFKKNFKPSKAKRKIRKKGNSIVWVAVFWLILNGVIYALHYMKIIDDGILVLISLAFSVCDMICILFFCPFQTWIMKNKCCTSCRIYNWDYAMMFTPLIFTKDILAVSIFVFGFVLLLRWEFTAHVHPERFFEETNECLSCSHCKEKLCLHKKQLQRFLYLNKNTFLFRENE